MNKSLAFTNIFDYKLVSVFVIFFTLISVVYFSYKGVFVRVTGIASYQRDFVVERFFMPGEYKNIEIKDCNIESDFFPKYSCVEHIDNNLAKLTNVLVATIEDDIYQLRIVKKNNKNGKHFSMHKNNIKN